MLRLTQVPLPSWKNLRDALMKQALSDSELSSPWMRAGDEAYLFSRSAWSLMAIARCRQIQMKQSVITIFLPAFFCNSSLSPLRNMGTKLIFYKIFDNLGPDLDDCLSLARKNQPDIFIHVHFFGKPISTDETTEFCRKYRTWLIEDAAHVLRPIAGIGEKGDFVLYSPHKLLPMPDGAIMVVRRNGPSIFGMDQDFFNFINNVYNSVINTPNFSYMPMLVWISKRVAQKFGIRFSLRRNGSFFLNGATVKTKLEHPKISSLAKRLLSVMLCELDNIANARLQNRLLWENLLQKVYPNKRSIWNEDDTTTPYYAGFIFENEAEAEQAFMAWHRSGLPVTTWPDLPPEVIENKTIQYTALKLRNTRVYLHIHQSPKKMPNDLLRKDTFKNGTS